MTVNFPPLIVGALEVALSTPSLAGTHSHYRLETEPKGQSPHHYIYAQYILTHPTGVM